MAFAQSVRATEFIENVVLGHESLIALLPLREKG